MNPREKAMYVCPCCGEIRTMMPDNPHICRHCHIILVETDKKRGDLEDARSEGKEFQFRESIRERYVYNSPKFNQEVFQKVCGQEYKDQELLHKLDTTLHCPRCWSFNVKETFVSSIITGLFFSATPTWFCNNCHFKWKQ